jgi:hypothetical protein
MAGDSSEQIDLTAAAAATERSEASTGQAAAAAGGSGIAEGGCPSNTHPQTSQEAALPGCSISGGFDWLAWSASVEWGQESFKQMMQEFQRAKIGCQELKQAFEWVELEGIDPVRVFRTGFNRGGDAGQHLEFKLSYHDVNIGLSRERVGTDRQPNFYAELTGRNCLLLGAAEGYQLMRKLVRTLGGIVQWERIARVDFCLDVGGLDTRSLQTVVEAKQFITTAKNVQPHGNVIGDKKTGFSVGKRPLRLVVYDKICQLATKNDALYLQAMIDRRYGGIRPEKATRVEFQTSRHWLRKQGVDSPDDVFRLAGAIVGKLSHQWFRLTDEPVDRKHNNQGRVATLPAWMGIGVGLAQVFGQPMGELIPIQRERVRPERLIRQGFGCLISAMLQIGRPCENLDDVLLHIFKLIEGIVPTAFDEEKLIKNYQRCLTEYAA